MSWTRCQNTRRKKPSFLFKASMKLFSNLKLIQGLFLLASACVADQSILTQANTQLALGRFNDAANLYTQAIGEWLNQITKWLNVVKINVVDSDPNSYLSYYKRATAYLSLGRNSAALNDLETVLQLQPTFEQVGVLGNYELRFLNISFLG